MPPKPSRKSGSASDSAAALRQTVARLEQELQIEAALERVRSASMAMHQTDELQKVVRVVAQELKKLGVVLDVGGAVICTYFQDNKDVIHWTASEDPKHPSVPFYLPYFEDALFDEAWDSKSRGDSYFAKVFPYQVKNAWFEKAFETSDYGQLPADYKKALLASKDHGIAWAWSANSAIMIPSMVGALPSEREKEILIRFAKVFEQAFIRFLDLQKAEAQAREAQIEAALERVRARSMVMHASAEMLEVANVMFQQLRGLGDGLAENLWGCGVMICNPDSDQDEVWFANQYGVLPPITMPHTEDPTHLRMYEAWKKKADLFSEFREGADLKKHYDYMLTVPSVRPFFQEILASGLSFPTWQKWHAACFSHGYLLILTTEVYENERVFTRFAKVFEQAYVRFLDLQKAEAQAREAQIENALEKVRSRALAMHRSDELVEVVRTVLERLRELELPADAAAIFIFREDHYEDWFATTASEYPTAKHLPLRGGAVMDAITTARESNEDFVSLYLPFEEKNAFFDIIFEYTDFKTIPEERKKYLKACEALSLSAAIEKNSGIQLNSYSGRIFTDQENEVLRRFARVFEQAYTRFLDLQKAEVQAREAEIQLALERVRAKSMAMQSSDELHEVLSVLFQQFDNLRIHPVNVFLSLFDRKSRTLTYRASGKSGTRIPGKQVVEVDSMEPLKALFDKWINDNSDAVEVIYYPKEVLPHLFGIFTETFASMPEEDRMGVDDFPEGGYSMAGYTPFGYLGYDHQRQATEEEKDILSRFCTEFTQVYQRFLDLQKAEAQAREAEIQLALERVRARTMAMHKSEELGEVAAVLFQQISLLSNAPDRFQIGIIDEEKQTWKISATDQGGHQLSKTFTFQIKESPVNKEMYEAWKNQDTTLVQHLSGRSLENWGRYLRDKIGLPFDQDQVKNDRYINSIFFSHGFIGMATDEARSADSFQLMERFAVVFQQTYTRFLDLQKSEAQAREAQIEASLERVRARSMAMHQSSELQTVVNTLFEQVKSLQIPLNSASIFILEKGKKDWQQWVATDTTAYSTYFHLPYGNFKVQRDFQQAREQGQDFYTAQYNKKQKNSWFEHAFAKTEYRRVPKQRQGYMLETDRLIFSVAIQKHIALQLAKYEGDPFTEPENETLARFAKVFEQAYTRFLDLQKAEAQAREAQIEAALERVRTKAMAMNNTSDLTATAGVIFSELMVLGITPMRSGVSIQNRKNRNILLYSASATPNGHMLSLVGSAVLDHHPVLREIYDRWLQNEDYYAELRGEQLTSYYKAIEANFKVPKEQIEKEQFGFFIPYSQGCLYGWSETPIADADRKILRRFASVVDLTFNRYFDLKKAEEQARESEIQLALERVRAATMAMHTSQELSEVAAVLFRQMRELGVTPERLNIGIVQEPDGIIEYWSTEQGGKQIDRLFKAAINEPTTISKLYAGWKAAQPILELHQTGKELAQWLRHMKKVLGMPFDENLRQERRVQTAANFKHGMLLVSTPDPVSEETKTLLHRFAGVFEQTYTRFLDLQKAEAQAREAQIEAALERVRARSMAMHRSSELNIVLAKVFEELTSLEIAMERAVIWIYHPENRSVHWWAANPEAESGSESYFISNQDDPVYNEYWKAWKERRTKYLYILEGDYKENWTRILFNDTELKRLPEVVKAAMVRPEKVYLYNTFNDFGVLFIACLEPLPDEKFSILERFGKVFDQSYTRFQDIQKAEAQAREAQIEAALERVRAKTMAMHNTDDIAATVTTFFNELLGLDPDASLRCGVGILSQSEQMQLWTASVRDASQTVLHYGTLDMSQHPLTRGAKENWASNGTPFSYTLKGQDLKRYFQILNEAPDYPARFDLNALPKEVYHNSFVFRDGILFVFTYTPLPGDIRNILERFVSVFGQTYTRYLDLQQAETRAREARIEAALERVRSRSMAMHHTDELQDVINTVYQQFLELKVAITGGAFIAINADIGSELVCWGAGGTAEYIQEVHLPFMDMPIYTNLLAGIKKGPGFFVESYSLEEKQQFFKALFRNPPYSEGPASRKKEILSRPGGYTRSCVVSRNTSIFVINHHGQPFSDEDNDILRRMGKVFEQTYTRYLDLQKAELRAREAQIEAAMERIRSRALAMRSSKEIMDVMIEQRRQIDSLGQLDLEASVVHLYTEGSKTFESIAAVRPPGDSGEIVLANVHFPVDATEQIRYMIEMYHSPQAYYTIEFTKEMAEQWQEVMLEHAPMIAERRVGFVDNRRASDRSEYWNFADFTGGSLLLVTHSPASEDTLTVLQKAAFVFDLAYRRHLDLVEAEEREQEAIKQASLDRVRAEIASMRSAADLERITPLVWNELTTLGVPFFRCGVFIVDEKDRQIHSYLSNPKGESLAVWHVGFGVIPVFDDMVTSWQEQEVFKTEWDRQGFLDFSKTLMDHGLVDNRERYQSGADAPEHLVLHMVPFAQGMLYVGSQLHLNPPHMELVQALAGAFSVAYARYEDFRQLEKTLSELKATQAQLIQSEKMASLGELTAGIAHEIKNPLNFVNNFSDVSRELLSELLEELEKGDMEEVRAIARDVSDNLEKIVHHGSRADSIVKGMLQHSRSGDGKKEPADLNALADEYLRLAYHGLRAKDKSFNATLSTDFDPRLPRVSVVPQDIGRVLLNLLTNAFYAVSEKAREGQRGYVPTVSIRTAREDGRVVIAVSDNGNGIPEKVREKVFQPFFTTKPTGQGTGLGLSMSYDIVTKGHGGELRAETEEGRGTTFFITFKKES